MFYLRELHQQGLSLRSIARQTGHCFKTVKKYLETGEPPRYKPRERRPNKLDPYKEYILHRLRDGLFNCVVLHEEVQAMGYEGGITRIKQFVRPYRPLRPNQKAVVRFETAPGEQAQVDFGVFKYTTLAGEEKRVYAFCYVLSYSRVHYVEFVERQDQDTFLRCHLNAFEATGGVPASILYDNVKMVVLGRQGGQPEWQPRFADFASLVGFVPKLCRPYRAQTKGRVERLVRYLRENFWPGRSFTSLGDLNHQVWAWCDKTNRRVHGTTRTVPLTALQGELPRLQAVPERMRVEHLLGEVRDVSRDGFVSWDGSRYGVPWQFSGGRVVVKDRKQFIEIWDGLGRTRIVLHARGAVRGSTLLVPGQYNGLLPDGDTRSRTDIARQLDAPEVQVRPLSAYEALLGGGRR